MITERLVLRDRAGCMWLLGLMFLGGGCMVAALLLGAGSGPQLVGWSRLLAGVIALAHISAGTWLLTGTPNIVVRLARDRPVLIISKRWFLVRREQSIHLDDMAGLTLRQEKDSDGDPVYRLELRLRDGSELRLHSVALHARPEIEAAVEALRVWSSNKLPVRTRTEP